jgi:hypothetical protein
MALFLERTQRHANQFSDFRSRSSRYDCRKEIVRTLSVSRATVRKVIRGHKTEFKYERGVQPTPKLGDWVEVLTEILAVLCRRLTSSRLLNFERAFRASTTDGAPPNTIPDVEARCPAKVCRDAAALAAASQVLFWTELATGSAVIVRKLKRQLRRLFVARMQPFESAVPAKNHWEDSDPLIFHLAGGAPRERARQGRARRPTG